MLFSLKQKFYGVMYNLCSQHLQSLNSVQQKLFVLQPLKDMFHMRAPALQADLDSPGKVLNDPPDRVQGPLQAVGRECAAPEDVILGVNVPRESRGVKEGHLELCQANPSLPAATGHASGSYL